MNRHVAAGGRDAVEGWLTDEQADVLAAAAGTCPADGTIVEIGSFRGKSTIVLARAAPRSVRIYAIDPHAGTDRGPRELTGFAAEADADRDAFDANLRAAGVDTRVIRVAAFSGQAHHAVGGRIEILYIDGAHRFQPARGDVRDWGARVAPGGTLLLHDAFSSVGVTAAIGRELVLGGRFRYVGRTRSLAEYRADLGGGVAARLANAARQLAQAPWFLRNVVLKAFLAAGGAALLRRAGRTPPEWPY